MKAYPIIRIAFSLILHISALSIVLFAFLQIAQWYFFHRPILGVDFFNTATYVKFFHEHFHILPYGFRYFWYGGSPIADDVVLTWFIIYSFFARVFPLIESIKIANLFFFALLAIFMYLASFRLSKNHFVSALVTVLVIYSANMYGSLVWGGSLPYFANQLFFPAVLWIIASYLQTGNRRWYWAAVFVVGLSFLGHLANGGAFIFIGSVILLLFGVRAKPVRFLHRIGDIVVFFVVSNLFAYRVANIIWAGMLQALGGSLPSLGGNVAKISIGSGGISVSGNSDIIGVDRSRFLTLFSDTHTLLLLLFGISFFLFVIAFLIDKKKRNALGVLAWIFLAGYSVTHVFLNAYGISFLAQAWYRAFWHFPITLGLSIAALIGYSTLAFGSLFRGVGRVFYLALAALSIVVLASLFFTRDSDKTIELLESRSSPSSSHPEVINLVRSQNELDALKPKLVPTWLNPNDRMYRLYTSDAQVNVWWNALFDMPLVRWYIEPPLGTGVMGDQYLLDQAVGGNDLVKNYDYSEGTAKNMALYYLDWYAVRYAEGGRLSKTANKAPSSYLKDYISNEQQVEVKGAYILYQTKSGKPEVWENVPQYLRYFQFRDELVPPILSVNNSPSVLCICQWSAYESVTKILSINNINSQFLVSIFYPENIDSLSVKDLSTFDAVILIDYRYGNKTRAFSQLKTFVERGGKVFIDTGSEIPESESNNLPDLFPFDSTIRAGLGKDWDFEALDNPVFDNVNFEEFSPPTYNDGEWKFSYPKGEVDSDASVLLRNHNKPVLIRKKIGKGEVLWSGINLAYHVHANTNVEESRFFINLLQTFIPLVYHPSGKGKPNFIDDRHVSFVADNPGKGILFKEQFFTGWKARINGKETKAYRAGPAFPGFIYVPTSNGEVQTKADFSYFGNFSDQYKPRLITLITTLILLDLIIFNGFIITRRAQRLASYARQKVGKWWKREDEVEN